MQKCNTNDTILYLFSVLLVNLSSQGSKMIVKNSLLQIIVVLDGGLDALFFFLTGSYSSSCMRHYTSTFHALQMSGRITCLC